jgi:hypothetical protein
VAERLVRQKMKGRVRISGWPTKFVHLVKLGQVFCLH